MPVYSFRAFRVDAAYYEGEDGSILGETTLDIFDTDDSLHQTPANDPGNDQTFSIAGGPFISDYSVDFQDFSVVNGGTTEFELFAFEMNVGSAPPQYYVFSKDPGFNPSPGDALTVSAYNNFTVTEYGNIGSAVCFLPGTRILTELGQRPIEDIRVGERIWTKDKGMQPARWVRRRMVRAEDMRVAPRLLPMELKPGLCGNTDALWVSQNHAVHTSALPGLCQLFPDHIIRAKFLPRIYGGQARIARGKAQVEYYHVLCDTHELISANNALAESMRLAPCALDALTPNELRMLRAIRPDVPRLSRALARRTRSEALMPKVRPEVTLKMLNNALADGQRPSNAKRPAA